ncbi:MAG: hypothetical protein A2469_02015 [Candidatus Magasanikbacteria bacterium RIFOXYC2_FULL_40_16]|uniref:GerMN domain-containing protein n=1 Tax=Candidatus Magasanikbacteria bacterium RIFOXYC2_FULL_40_16 TaxID=1798703 RepID=A0A1F6P1F3_9BACT|nr:MAG: hypothetical protein A2224_02060 [Candidatus Magasanikbacteria bacterium RIFOXYA2_FULL_40_20]OGH89774.1 MAG: hypothetical protein A2469_02015 [Candidatus Magasanikbacteria bacterium RIFOXYC2_FULL_40_16]
MLKNRRNLIILIAGAVVLLVLFFLRGQEDTWICEENGWVKHGMPDTPMPTEPCGEESAFCTADAKLCPDGSYVGRVAPKCDFAPCPEMRKIKLYYYNYNLDKDETGNVQCSRNGLVAVEREAVSPENLIQDTIKLLLKGELTEEEKAQGIATEYPLPGFSLTDFSLEDGVLNLTFDDPNNRSGGGSCRVGVLWFQIEATAKQFPEVKEVHFWPEELFQP